MKLNEIINDPLLAYHDELNPKLWIEGSAEYALDPDVEKALLKIAARFVEALKLPPAAIKDYVLTGSNANYNWTKLSDIDVHVMVDYDHVECKDCRAEAEDCLLAKKSLWNDRHNIDIRGQPVELYASDAANDSVKDSGAYSLLRKKWIVQPARVQVDVDSPQIKAKANELASQIDEIINSKSDDEHEIKELVNKIWKYRQSGLQRGGEFSIENLVFKTLRNNGYLDKIRTYQKKLADRQLSFEGKKWKKVYTDGKLKKTLYVQIDELAKEEK